MKTRSVETVVNNDEHVRLKIYDGDIPVDAYWQDIAQAYRGQMKATQERFSEVTGLMQARINQLEADLAEATKDAA